MGLLFLFFLVWLRRVHDLEFWAQIPVCLSFRIYELHGIELSEGLRS